MKWYRHDHLAPLFAGSASANPRMPRRRPGEPGRAGASTLPQPAPSANTQVGDAPSPTSLARLDAPRNSGIDARPSWDVPHLLYTVRLVAQASRRSHPLLPVSTDPRTLFIRAPPPRGARTRQRVAHAPRPGAGPGCFFRQSLCRPPGGALRQIGARAGARAGRTSFSIAEFGLSAPLGGWRLPRPGDHLLSPTSPAWRRRYFF